jgi:multiple antibiotic resistance protein
MNWPEIAATAATLFFVMDPLGNIPIFNAVLGNFESRHRALIVARELVFALGIMLAFLFAGTAILEFLNLSSSSLNIAGGVLLFIIAIRMIFPGQRGEVEEVDDDPFIVPLAMPLVAGPSTLALLLLLSSSQPERIWDWCAALVLAWAGSTVLLTASPFMLRALGKRGLRAIGRLMGMLLVLLATQMLLDGVAAFVRELG